MNFSNTGLHLVFMLVDNVAGGFRTASWVVLGVAFIWKLSRLIWHDAEIVNYQPIEISLNLLHSFFLFHIGLILYWNQCHICSFLECRSSCETLSTLRFGQRVKSIHNEPVINEISEDDVNDLSDQIRQLKVLKLFVWMRNFKFDD